MMNYRFTRSRQFSAALALMLGLAASPSVAADPQGVPPQSTLINEELSKAWTENKLKPSRKASDYEFCRRVFIDLIGRIPTAEEVRDFAENDASPNKRAKLVHRLMYDKDYKLRNAPAGTPSMDYATEHARHMANLWGVWLMTRGGVAEVYHDSLDLWLEDQFLKNTPWNQIVRELLTAKGKSSDNGAVAFMMSHLGEKVPAKEQMAEGKFDMVPITSRVSRLFLGIQTNCMQCHDHPFNSGWKQQLFWGLNAFFRQVERDIDPALKVGGNNKKMAALPVTLTDNPELNKAGFAFFETRQLVGVATKANFLPNLTELINEEAGPPRRIPADGKKTRREYLADYILAHDNFSKAYVNRMWSHFFGRGMNELPAADDFGGHNKVVHENLLNRLGEEFVKYGYDSKKLMEWICNSDAYSLTYQANGLKEGAGGNAKDDVAPYFSRMQLKSMSPEVLFESLEVATRLDSAPDKDAKKAKRDAWMNQLVRNFGDDEGNETTFNGTIIQALLMMNGTELNSEISRKDGTSAVDKAMNKYKSANGYNEMAIINELYLMALARKPSSQATIYVPQKDPKTGKDIVDSKGKPIMSGPISELQFLSNQIAALKRSNPNPAKYRAFFEDVFWSLLNTSEFILNH